VDGIRKNVCKSSGLSDIIITSGLKDWDFLSRTLKFGESACESEVIRQK
jgi:hypothetical protein